MISVQQLDWEGEPVPQAELVLLDGLLVVWESVDFLQMSRQLRTKRSWAVQRLHRRVHLRAGVLIPLTWLVLSIVFQGVVPPPALVQSLWETLQRALGQDKPPVTFLASTEECDVFDEEHEVETLDLGLTARESANIQYLVWIRF